MVKLCLFISLMCLSPLQTIFSQEQELLPMQRSALFLDLSQSMLSWEAGGIGLSLEYERALSGRFSLIVGGIYMNLPVDPTSPRILLASLGPRFYFALPAVQGFYTGLYPIAGYGIVDGAGSFLAGLIAELGYAWRVGPGRRFILEPYIKYPYIFGQDPLIGIAPGLSLGWAF
jgi:hypothetical protein